MPDGDMQIWQAEWKPRRRRETVILVVLALVAVAWVIGIIAARHAAPRSTAQAIAAGYDKSRAANPADPEDDALQAAEADAGYMWAKSHRIERATQCPEYSPEFRAGCADFVNQATP